MRTLRILPVVLAAAVCCSVQAQPRQAIQHLSGDFTLTAGLDLTSEGTVPFSALLYSRVGDACQLNGKLRVYNSSPRRVETVPGATFIHCPGAAPALVVGHVVPATWTPTQLRRCRTYSYSKYGSSCLGHSVTVPTGTSGMWITWHALTSEQIVQKKGVPHD